eukprot:14892531-Alexandrium_andersonii.AAC.1
MCAFLQHGSEQRHAHRTLWPEIASCAARVGREALTTAGRCQASKIARLQSRVLEAPRSSTTG